MLLTGYDYYGGVLGYESKFMLTRPKFLRWAAGSWSEMPLRCLAESELSIRHNFKNGITLAFLSDHYQYVPPKGT